MYTQQAYFDMYLIMEQDFKLKESSWREVVLMPAHTASSPPKMKFETPNKHFAVLILPPVRYRLAYFTSRRCIVLRTRCTKKKKEKDELGKTREIKIVYGAAIKCRKKKASSGYVCRPMQIK